MKKILVFKQCSKKNFHDDKLVFEQVFAYGES